MDRPMRPYLMVGVDGEMFGLDVGRVRTVLEYREPIPLPGRPLPLLGALNHHGNLLPLAPLATLLGRVFTLDPLRSVIVVVGWEDSLLGLVVETAEGLVSPPEGTRLTHVLGRWDGPYLEHTLETEGRRIHVLDLDTLLADLAGGL